MICKTYPLHALEGSYKYVVVLSRMNGHILLSRHKQRTTWETQGGHIESGETPLQAARRELFEESGAEEYTLMPLCDYWAGSEDGLRGESGMVFTANIRKLGDMPESEMAQTRCFDALPEGLTYPPITKTLFAYLESAPTRVLIGTTNPSKVSMFAGKLDGTHTQLFTLRDLEICGEPAETGSTLEENAEIKAAYYARYADNVICMDSGLYLDALALDDARQPGLHVRTPNGCERLDDEQMIAHYAALAHELGGHALAYYMNAVVIMQDGKMTVLAQTRQEARQNAFYLTDTVDERRRPGWPLDSLSLCMDGTRFLDVKEEAVPACEGSYDVRMKKVLREKLGAEACSAAV